MRTQIDRVLRAAVATPWAIMPEKLEEIAAVLDRRSALGELPRAEIEAITMAAAGRRSARVDPPAGVAVIQVFGTIAQRMDSFDEMSGGTSAERIGAAIDAAIQDPGIGTIILQVDSPGGSVYGIPELGAKIFAARGEKKIIAVADSLMASAAYWIGSAADEIVMTPGGEVGSIGVFCLHVEGSKYFAKEGITPTIIRAPEFKAERNQFEPLTAEARAAEQAKIEEIYGRFVEAIAAHRGVTDEEVRNGFALGRTALAREALESGMVDRVATMDEVLADLGVSRAQRSAARIEETAMPIAASELISVGTPLGEIVHGSITGREIGASLYGEHIPSNLLRTIHITTTAEGAGAAPAVRSEQIPTNQPAPKAKENTVENETTTAAQSGAATQTPVVRVGAERDVERQRSADILNLCSGHGLGMDKAQAYLAGGMSVEAVGLDILRTARENHAAITAPAVEMSDREVKQYSVRRAIVGQIARLEGGSAEDGFEREISEEIQKRLPRDYKPRGGVFVPTRFRASQVNASSLFAGINPAALQALAAMDPALAGRLAALNTGTGTAGGNTVFTEGGELIDMLRPRMKLAALGVSILSGLGGPIGFPRQTGASNWGWVGENPGADQADSDATVGQVTLSPKSGQATTAYSRQLLTESSIDLDSFVQNDLNTIAALGIDKAGIQGSGSGNEPAGILNTAGVNIVAIGTNGGAPTYAHAVDLETQVAVDNADIGVMAYLTTPGIRGKLKTTERFANSGFPVWDGAELNGYRAEVSTQVPSNLTKGTGTALHAILFGVWSQLLLGYFGAYELIADPYSKKKQGLIEVTAFQMVGLANRNPEAFGVVKDAVVG